MAQGEGQPAGSEPAHTIVKEYQIIYSDPPWRYATSTPNRAIENHYPTMAIDDICALPVPAAKDSVLFLWATAPLLREGLRVLDAWGFAYKSCAVWNKEIIGMGYWFRGQHELLLVGTKGIFSPPPADLRVSSIIDCRRGKHSSKPDYIRHLIEGWYPQATRLEMFTRMKRPGWDAFGNQVEHDLFSGQAAIDPATAPA
jgi:N6-adenosine-specific RNA methylase IME4